MTANNAIVPASSTDLQPLLTDLFDALVAQVERGLSKVSARVYRQTYDQWRAWCQQHDLDPLELRPGDVTAYLASKPTVKKTRQRELTALRKLAQTQYVLTPSDDPHRLAYTQQVKERLFMIKAPSENGSTHERPRRALTPSQANRLLDAWSGGEVRQRLIHARNKALVAVLLLTGIRRTEAAALRWQDIDFENGVLSVRHGKGDKAREVPIAGDAATDALAAWRQYSAGREWVFCAIRRGGHLGADKPIKGNDVYNVVLDTGKLAGVEWKPHDGRRTFITEALATGAPLATVQAAAGHAQGSTTLLYAQAVNAAAAKKLLKLRYG